MKKIIFSALSIVAVCLFAVPATAQKSNKKIQTESFQVQGVCEMCKNRIEKAALQSGVMSAAWDKEQQELTVIYKPAKVALKEVKVAVAAAGHDTEEIKATEEQYAKLPDCCAYRDGVKVH